MMSVGRVAAPSVLTNQCSSWYIRKAASLQSAGHVSSLTCYYRLVLCGALSKFSFRLMLYNAVDTVDGANLAPP